MNNLNFKQWLTEQGVTKHIDTPEDKILNAEIEKEIITQKAKGGTSAQTMAPNTLAKIITPNLLRNQQVQKAIKDKLNKDTANEIARKKLADEEAAKKSATSGAKPATVKTIS